MSALVTGLIVMGFVALQGAEAQQSFGSPEKAIEALGNAVRSGDTARLLAILGPGSKDLVSSGDEVADQLARTRFLKAYDEARRIEKVGDTRVILSVGHDGWSFPIPLVKKAAQWRFNMQEGKEEMLNRRIGQNELSTIQVCLAYVDAQREYASQDRDHDGVLEYAQKFFSERGKRDGLYWETGPGEAPSPLGPHAAEANAAGYVFAPSAAKPTPYYGYYYRILKAQGKDARGGAYAYMMGDNMSGGFALVAFPAQYSVSGIMTFIVNHAGVVYQKDLGRDTEAIASQITEFNPDQTWKQE
jgi:hypothetical protein